MADEITKLTFEIEQKGAAKVEQHLRNIEGGVISTLNQYKKFSSDGAKTTKDFVKNMGGMQKSLANLEQGIAKAGEEYGGMFSSGQMKRQERRIQGIRKEMMSLTKVIQSGSEEQQKMAMERMKTLQKAADMEVKTSAHVFKNHKEEFDRLVSMKKKSLGELGQEAAKGSASAIQALMRGDISGVAGMAQQGLRGAGEQAQKAAFDRQMAGGAGAAGGAQMTKLLKTFAKVAGPIAMIAGAVGMLVKLFLDFDSRIKEVNKSMLQNVSLVELAGSNYSNLAEASADADFALRMLQRTVMSDMDLRRMGLDPDEMSGILNTMHQQGMLLGDLADQGVDYSDALMTAQVAALNLGVGADETAGLIGTLADVTASSFEEAAESLTQIVAFSRDAGVSTQRFFNTVQSVVGQMGLYNYRIEETAALFSRLSNIMDADSAEGFVQELSTAFKNASALERTTTVVVNGLGRVAEMADRTQQSLLDGLDTTHLETAFSEINAGDLFDAMDIEGSMERLSRDQRNQLQRMLRTVDDNTARQFERYRRLLEANRGSVMDLQGVLSDFAIGDQIALQIGELETKLRMPIEDMNSVLAESQGISEDQLRMLQSFKTDMEAELSLLQQAAETGNEAEFAEIAEQLGYQVSLDEFQNQEISNWTDLLRVMTEEKQDAMIDEQREQKTLAERSAEMQRSLLDTIKYQLLDFVSGIYDTLLRLYHVVINSRMLGGTEEDRQRAEEMLRTAEDRFALRDLRRERDTVMESGDEGRLATIDREIERRERSIRLRTRDGVSKSEADGMAFTGFDDAQSYESELRRFRGMLDIDREDVGWFDTEDGRRLLMTEQTAGSATRVEGRAGRVQDHHLEGYLDQEARRLMMLGSNLEEDIHEQLLEAQESGNLLESLTEIESNVERAITDRGIEISSSAMKDLASEIVMEQLRAEIFRDLVRAGVREDDAGWVAGAIATGSSADSIMAVASDEGIDLPSQAISSIRDKYYGSAGDARIVTGGIPLLNLRPGDIIVDQDALAQTVAGSRGTYVPEFLKQMGAGEQRSALQNVMYATFNVSGGNPQEIRNIILRVLQEWERERSVR